MKIALKRKIPPGIDIEDNGGESSSEDDSDNISQPSSIFSFGDTSIQDHTNISKSKAKTILEEIGDDVFSLLFDVPDLEYTKKQIILVFRYVDAFGIVHEKNFGLVNVLEISALSLKSSIDSFFAQNGLSLKKVRGQSYNGTSDMRDEFNGLKDLIKKENSSAYYVHCFGHQLESVVVAIAKTHFGVGNFFDMIAILNKVVCTSCKRKDMIRESDKKKVQEAISISENENALNHLFSSGGNKVIDFHRNTLSHVLHVFPSIFKVLEYVEEEGDTSLSPRQANGLHIYLKSFDFVFYLHLMLQILGITHVLPRALLGEGKDVLNAMLLAKSTKQVLEKFRADGFDSLLKEIFSFCEKHDIGTMKRAEDYVNPKNPKQKTDITYRQYYEFDCFNTVVNAQIEEFHDRFSEESSELLICTIALNPRDSFREFNRSKLLKLAKMYPDDFSCAEMMMLEHQLDFYIDIIKKDKIFVNLESISDLARVMVETKKHIVFPLVYRLLKLALVLPVL